MIYKLIKELKAYKRKHKLTMDALAMELGVSKWSVKRWFQGKYAPSWLSAAKIMKLVRGKDF